MNRMLLAVCVSVSISFQGCDSNPKPPSTAATSVESMTAPLSTPRVPVKNGRLGIPIGVEIEGGVMHVMIPFDSELPKSEKLLFSTATDNQSSVSVRVLQGFRPIIMYNQPLATYDVSGIQAAPRGVPQIEVTLSVDPEGNVAVKAQDLTTAGLGVLVSEIGPVVTWDSATELRRIAKENLKADESMIDRIRGENLEFHSNQE